MARTGRVDVCVCVDGSENENERVCDDGDAHCLIDALANHCENERGAQCARHALLALLVRVWLLARAASFALLCYSS